METTYTVSLFSTRCYNLNPSVDELFTQIEMVRRSEWQSDQKERVFDQLQWGGGEGMEAWFSGLLTTCLLNTILNLALLRSTLHIAILENKQ